MARIYQCGFETRQDGYEYGAANASVTPAITFETPGRSGISGTRYRRVQGNGFGSGTHSLVFSFVSATEVYGQIVYAISGGTGANCGFQLRDASNNNVFSLISTSPGGAITATLGTATSAGSVTGVYSSSFILIEFHLKIDGSVGELTVKFDGVEVLDFAGNTDPNSRVSVANLVIYGSNQQGILSVDDVIINDTTGGVEDSWVNNQTLLLLIPNANGDASDLTGSDGNQTDNYLLVDDFPVDGDATYVYADEPDLEDLYNLSDLPTLPDGSTIKLVQPIAIARRADAGVVSTIDVGIKSDDTDDYEAGQELLTTYSFFRGKVYYEDPDTASAWDDAGVNALQVGIKSDEP